MKLKCKENCSWKELTFSHPEQEASQAINQDGMTSYSENRKDDSEFLFELYLEEGTVYLSCKQGCAWKELSFDKPTEGTAQNIDHNGMTGRAPMSSHFKEIRSATILTGTLVLVLSFLTINSCGNDYDKSKTLADLDSVKEATPKLNIGGSEDDFIFGQHIFLNVDRDGKLYVTDNQQGSISIFDHSGEKIKRADLAGRGPGEFQAMNVLLNQESGRVGIYDEVQQRFTVYDALLDDVISTVNIDSPEDLYITLLGFDDDAIYFTGFKGFSLSNYDESRELHYLRASLNSHNSTPETVKTFPFTNHVVKANRSERYIHVAEQPFGRKTNLHHHNAHIYYTSNDTVGYHKFHTAEDKHDSLYLDFDRIEVTDDMVDTYIRHLYDAIDSDEIAELLINYITNEELFPEKAMHYNESFVDLEGRLWLKLYKELTPDKSQWAVLNPENKEIYRTEFPDNSFTQVNADLDHIYGIEIKENGIETVSIFEI